uniref:Uncharacterized protein n=1 Tax=Glossina pallidipes TaxID=7398 RepID=A0A1B0A5S8_GLOPL
MFRLTNGKENDKLKSITTIKSAYNRYQFIIPIAAHCVMKAIIVGIAVAAVAAVAAIAAVAAVAAVSVVINRNIYHSINGQNYIFGGINIYESKQKKGKEKFFFGYQITGGGFKFPQQQQQKKKERHSTLFM